MKTNKVLRVAAVFFKILMGAALGSVIFVTFVLIHSEIDPASYNNCVVENENGIRIVSSSTNPIPPETSLAYTNSKDKTTYFSKLNFASKFGIWIWVTMTFVLSILTLRELIRFVQSAKKYDSFFIDNSMVFMKIFKYMGVYIILNFILFFWHSNLVMVFPDGIVVNSHYVVNIQFSPFVIMLLLLVFSQVFKEGERMKQENELTI